MDDEFARAGRPERRKIVIFAYEGAKLLDISGPMQAFSAARFEDETPAYEVFVASQRGGPVVTDTGVRIDTMALGEPALEPVDTLLVAGFDPTVVSVSAAALGAQLADHLAAPRRIGSTCTGAFILARLGILDGIEATTHWAACDRLASDYPAIRVKPDAIFVSSGRIWTSAGVSAGIDMALAMIEQDLDHASALTVARGMVLFLKRPGGQSQFSIELRRQVKDARGRFDALHEWIRSHLDADLSVPALADAAAMSPRNFARVYQKETGDSPARAVEKLRVEAARRLLEATQEPIKVVARRTGFGDDEGLRRAFARAYGVSPQEYRGRFGRAPA